MAVDGTPPGLDARRRRPRGLGAGGLLLFLRGAGRDRALRPARPAGGPRPVLHGARPRRRAPRTARAHPRDGRGAPAQHGRAGRALRRHGRRGRGRRGGGGRTVRRLVFWIPGHRAVVFGDILLGREAAGCGSTAPGSRRERLRQGGHGASARCSPCRSSASSSAHGEPVLEDGGRRSERLSSL